MHLATVRTRKSGLFVVAGVVAAGLVVPLAGTSTAAAGSQGASQALPAAFTRVIKLGSTSTYQATRRGSGAYVRGEELQSAAMSRAAARTSGRKVLGGAVGARRVPGTVTGTVAPRATSSGIVHTGGQLVRSFQGLNHFDSRTANGGNQFSGEPPDQGLCVGNGMVVEPINNVIRVYSRRGQPLSGVEDLNTFLGYPAAVDRSANPRVYGPNIFDPSCLFDPSTKQFFFAADTLLTDPATGNPTGRARIDIAVTANPTGKWKIYHLDVTDDGSNGTPVHAHCPCFGDYPHIGVDANGFYLTTNEFPQFASGFDGAQIYAFSKRALASHARSIYVTQYNTRAANAGLAGFTVWPAQSPDAKQFDTANRGTEYFLSSTAVFSNDGTSTKIVVWALTNTSTVGTARPSAKLIDHDVTVRRYSVPPMSDQKSGSTPLRQCLNNASCATTLNGEPDPYAPEKLQALDSNDSRMQQVTYARGKLYGALDTGVQVEGTRKAGIAYFVVAPRVSRGHVSGTLRREGRLALAGNNLSYPAVGITSSGRGIISFTLVGADFHPSAAFATLNATNGAGAIRLAARGRGVQDGFSGYRYYGGGGAPGVARPRWGDYGATAVDGNTIWAAAEYIAQSCTLAQYEAEPFGTCGNTRTALANWSTRISQIAP